MLRRKIIRYEDEAPLLEQRENITHESVDVEGRSGTVMSPLHILLSATPTSEAKRQRPSYGTDLAYVLDFSHFNDHIWNSTRGIA